jgi:hypothetical protein
MGLMRRRLRRWATAALVMQTVWVFVLIPGSCCAAHDKEASPPPCHEETPATHCPLKATTGAACPMHGGDASVPARDRCTMRSGCDGPMAALLSLLSASGVTPDMFELIAELRDSAGPPPYREQSFGLAIPPDSPPPRA